VAKLSRFTVLTILSLGPFLFLWATWLGAAYIDTPGGGSFTRSIIRHGTNSAGRFEWVVPSKWAPADPDLRVAGLRLKVRAGGAGAATDVEVRLVIPLWVWLAITMLLPTAWLLRNLRLRRDAQANACPKCGYDLRASSGRCPECGTPMPARVLELPPARTENWRERYRRLHQ
jgi:hypothetical protein